MCPKHYLIFYTTKNMLIYLFCVLFICNSSFSMEKNQNLIEPPVLPNEIIALITYHIEDAPENYCHINHIPNDVLSWLAVNKRHAALLHSDNAHAQQVMSNLIDKLHATYKAAGYNKLAIAASIPTAAAKKKLSHCTTNLKREILDKNVRIAFTGYIPWSYLFTYKDEINVPASKRH